MMNFSAFLTSHHFYCRLQPSSLCCAHSLKVNTFVMLRAFSFYFHAFRHLIFPTPTSRKERKRKRKKWKYCYCWRSTCDITSTKVPSNLPFFFLAQLCWKSAVVLAKSVPLSIWSLISLLESKLYIGGSKQEFFIATTYQDTFSRFKKKLKYKLLLSILLFE